MELSQKQDEALKAVDRWYKHESKDKQIFRLFGYAGTGKSTLAKYFRQSISGQVNFMAFTGKASLVMSKKGAPATTIHSAIYFKKFNKEKKMEEWVLNKASPIKNSKLIIVDEVSMVDDEIAKDLMSFGVPILVLGDPGQLPPVKGTGYFTQAEPDVMLTEIHRQARDNPILALATMARKGMTIKHGNYGNCVVTSSMKMADALESDQVICGRNLTKDNMNEQIRAAMGYKGMYPAPGEKLICLKNNRQKGMLNGQMFTMKAVHPERTKFKSRFIHATVESEGGALIEVKIPKGYFDPSEPIDKYVLSAGDQMEPGYAISCHKAQGSEWPSILVYDESYCFREYRTNWLYTAVTRASDKLILIQN